MQCIPLQAHKHNKSHAHGPASRENALYKIRSGPGARQPLQAHADAKIPTVHVRRVSCAIMSYDHPFGSIKRVNPSEGPRPHEIYAMFSPHNHYIYA